MASTAASTSASRPGPVVGHYLPHRKFLKLVVEAAKAEVSVGELDRRAAAPGGMSLAAFWKKIGARP